MSEPPSTESETVLVVNPHSGSGDHADAIRSRGALRGDTLVETRRAGHAIELARQAVEQGASEVVAVGGDGTLNEVVRGVLAGDALDRVTVGVVPTGTGNSFAEHVGIPDIDAAFNALESGERRWLDLGMAGADPFVNSCVAGITAAASDETTPEMKSRFGVLAYVLTTLRVTREFSGMELRIRAPDRTDDLQTWDGEASVVLVGNCRRFSQTGTDQANVEDGFFDVTIIEDASALDLASDRVAERLFAQEGEHHTRLLASTLEIEVRGDDPVSFSLDGEIEPFDAVTIRMRERALHVPVGEGYKPAP